MVTLDVVIRNGQVIDGTGRPAVRCDIGIRDGRVDAVGDLSAAEAQRSIDATGLTVAPGFVDTHTHSEGDLLVNPQHEYGIRQGITTEIFGLDGVSYAPLSREHYLMYRRYLAGLLGDPPEDIDTTTVAAFRANYHQRVAVNTAYLVPHGAIRLATLGFRDAPLFGPALIAAERLVRESIDQGAVGLSSGLNYYPGAWSDTAEVTALAKATGLAGGVHVIELRYRGGARGSDPWGVAEAIEVGLRSGARIHLAHHRIQPETAGDLDALMGALDGAIASGLDCTFDIYPYPTGSSFPAAYLPSWAQEGGPDAILEHLRDPSERARIAEYLDREYGSRGGIALERFVFSYLPRQPELEGAALREIAEDRRVSMGTALCDLLLAEELKVGFCISVPESMSRWRQVSKDAMQLLARPDYMICSDITPLGGMPHPRSYGAFPRFLGRLRRAFGGLTLEQMVHRCTDVPARRFGLAGRGQLAPGYWADVVVFDADRLMDNATYDDPRQFPSGIAHVLVNGRIAVENERVTGVLAGHAVPD